jgi:2-C-methyl-D-erythritol 4-phosphate cytidylyltransferase
VVAGGSSRQASTLAGIKALEKIAPHNVLIHDAARPFLSRQIVQDVLLALEKYEAVDVAIPTADTIIVERDGLIQSIPKRKHLLRGQTPQAFRYAVLADCYRQVGDERLELFTDDCGIYLDCHPLGQVRIVAGHEENIKITHPIDLVLADEMFRLQAADFSKTLPGFDVRNKRAIIFGGTAGIGKALADILASSGSQVVVRSRSNGCDVSSEIQVQQAMDQAAQELGGIDYVINAAGVLSKSTLAHQASSDIEKQVNTNLLGAFWIAKAAFEYLKTSKGSLLLFASSSYTRGRSEYVAYSATKAAIVNMAQGLSEEWSDHGIQVNCLVPGRTDTEMRRNNFEGENPSTLCNPYEVALNAAKLLSSNFNGQTIRT